MADFCKQCSIDMWGRDTGDLSGLITEAEVKEGYGAVVVCEGCGVIRVDHEGKRLEEPEPVTLFPKVKNYWDVDQLADRRPLTPKVPRSIRGIPAKYLESSVTVSTTTFDSVNGRFDSSFSSQINA